MRERKAQIINAVIAGGAVRRIAGPNPYRRALLICPLPESVLVWFGFGEDPEPGTGLGFNGRGLWWPNVYQGFLLLTEEIYGNWLQEDIRATTTGGPTATINMVEVSEVSP